MFRNILILIGGIIVIVGICDEIHEWIEEQENNE